MYHWDESPKKIIIMLDVISFKIIILSSGIFLKIMRVYGAEIRPLQRWLTRGVWKWQSLLRLQSSAGVRWTAVTWNKHYELNLDWNQLRSYDRMSVMSRVPVVINLLNRIIILQCYFNIEVVTHFTRLRTRIYRQTCNIFYIRARRLRNTSTNINMILHKASTTAFIFSRRFPAAAKTLVYTVTGGCDRIST